MILSDKPGDLILSNGGSRLREVEAESRKLALELGGTWSWTGYRDQFARQRVLGPGRRVPRRH
jgi:hypothetical protein